MASTSASANANATQLLNANNFDLDLLIYRIDSFLAQKSPSRKNTSARTFLDIIQHASRDISKLLEGVSQGAEMISDQIKLLSNLNSEAQTTAVSILKGIGNAHWVAAGFSVVASVLERFGHISINNSECFTLLKKMTDLAKCIKDLKDKLVLEKKTEYALHLIVEGAIMCFTQISDGKFRKFRLVSKNREDLLQLDRNIEHIYRDLILSSNTINVVYKPVELPYPDHAIGIKHQVQQVTEYLECQSDMEAKAVIVYGVEGVGKTTITDAVFANFQKDLGAGYQTCFITLNEDPRIEELQAQILHILTGKRHEITHYKIGQDVIKKCLRKKHVLLYVDNVLRRKYLEQILPKKLHYPMKFRLLLTARERDVVESVESCGIERCDVYEIKPLSIDACTDILCSKIGIRNDGKRHEINKIAEKCSGIPLDLERIGEYLKRARRESLEAQAIERVLHCLEKGEAIERISCHHNFKEMLDSKLDELKAKSSIEVLFQNLDCFQQVRETMLQGQQICLYGGDPLQILDFTPVLSSSGFSASVPIIYVGRGHAEADDCNIEERFHEINRECKQWLSLSYIDAWKFWQHVEYLLEDLVTADEREDLAKYRVSLGILSLNNRSRRGVWMTMVDETGEVMSESNRMKVVQQLKKGQDCRMDMVIQGISCGEMEELLKQRFEDGVFPQQHHSHHSIPSKCGILCDMCNQRIKSSFYWTCSFCRFDLCSKCYHLSSGLAKK